MRIAPNQPSDFSLKTTAPRRSAPNDRQPSRGWWLSLLWVVCLFSLGGWFFLPSSSPPIQSTAAISTAAPEYITKAIGEIREGDIVLSRDEFGNDIGLKRVVEVYLSTADHLRILTFQSFDGAEQTLKTTDDHPFWVVSRDAFVMARFLQPGDQLTSPHGARQRLIRSIYEPHPEGVPVYNFQVEDYHTCYVGEASPRPVPILVHNANEPCVPTRARHHTDKEGLKGIKRDNAINPSRDDGLRQGVDVEVAPFGPTKPGALNGPRRRLGAAGEGAHVEFDLPGNARTTRYVASDGSNTARIPTDTPLPISELKNVKFVVRPWWKFW